MYKIEISGARSSFNQRSRGVYHAVILNLWEVELLTLSPQFWCDETEYEDDL